jgi:adenine specific DNA methylase Mod
MAKTNLSDEEKKLIIEALNNNVELPAELMIKLFPGLAEKFDVAKLDRAKIVTLEYAGKRSEAAILNQASPTDAGSPLQVERCFKGGSLTGETQLDLFESAKDSTDDNWQNLIVQGDNLQFLKTCCRNADPLTKDRVKGKVKLIYIDPPFATKADFQSKEGATTYSDKVASSEFLENLRERFIFMREILADDGSIYVHLDWRLGQYVKVLMDEIFGKDNFRNEINVKRIRKNVQERDRVPRLNESVDSIFFYAKNKEHLIIPPRRYNPKPERWHSFEASGHRNGMDYELFGFKPKVGNHWRWTKAKANQAIKDGKLRANLRTGKPEYKIESSKNVLRDTLWDDITASAFTTGYNTEKSESLLRVIIEMSSGCGKAWQALDCM